MAKSDGSGGLDQPTYVHGQPSVMQPRNLLSVWYAGCLLKALGRIVAQGRLIFGTELGIEDSLSSIVVLNNLVTLRHLWSVKVVNTNRTNGVLLFVVLE